MPVMHISWQIRVARKNVQMQAFMSGDIDASAAKADALSFLALLPAILLVLVVVLLSAYLRLSLHTATIVATIRQAHRLPLVP